jgi:hypothetical protein
MKALDEKEESEHYGEWYVEFVSEYSERKQRFSDKVPYSIIQALIIMVERKSACQPRRTYLHFRG